MGDLEDDIKQMVQMNENISLEEVLDAIYAKLRENIIEKSSFYQIIDDMVLKMANESKRDVHKRYFYYFFKDRVDSALNKKYSEHPQFLFKTITKQMKD